MKWIEPTIFRKLVAESAGEAAGEAAAAAAQAAVLLLRHVF